MFQYSNNWHYYQVRRAHNPAITIARRAYGQNTPTLISEEESSLIERHARTPQTTRPPFPPQGRSVE